MSTLSSSSSSSKPLLSSRISQTLASTSKFLSFVTANISPATLASLISLLQLLLLFLLPRYVAALPAILYLTHKLLTSTPNPQSNPLLRGINHGKHIAQIPHPDTGITTTQPHEGAPSGLVVFIVGAQANHPLGLLAPGFKEMGDYFFGIWEEAAADKETSGYLHHTAPLAQDPELGGRVTVSISYWRSLEHLQRFAAKGKHREAMRWWGRGKEGWPHLGIFHETYVCQERAWENVYENVGGFGLAGMEGAVKNVDGKRVGLSWRMGRE